MSGAAVGAAKGGDRHPKLPEIDGDELRAHRFGDGGEAVGEGGDKLLVRVAGQVYEPQRSE